ncbi:MAG: hypothetical protein HYT16_03750 [DPANN group archaeon]|nr:hypothetical protein [DPANN group archaeon]
MTTMFGIRRGQSEQSRQQPRSPLLTLRRPQYVYDRIAQKRFRRPDSFFDDFYRRHARRPGSFYDARMEGFLLSLTPEMKAAGAVSRIEEMLQDMPLQLSDQARAFVMVPNVNDKLEEEGFHIGTVSGQKGNGEFYMLGLIFAGPDIIAYDVNRKNGVILTYRAKTPDELRAKLTQTLGGSWHDCMPKAPRFLADAGQQSREALYGRLLRRANRPAGLAAQFLAEGARTPAGEDSDDFEILMEGAPTPQSLREQYLTGRRAARIAFPAQLRDTWPARNVDLTGMSGILGLDAPASAQPISGEGVELERQGRQVQVTENSVAVTRPGRTLQLLDEQVQGPVAQGAAAEPAPTPPERQRAPEERAGKRVDVKDAVVSGSEIDSDLVERVIQAETVHIGTLNIHVHKGMVPKPGEEE